MVMEHVGLGEAIEPDFPFVALALYEVPYPVLLFGRERPFAVFVLVVHLRAMQVLGDGLAHTGEVLFHHLVVECRETFRHHHFLSYSRQWPSFAMWGITQSAVSTLSGACEPAR